MVLQRGIGCFGLAGANGLHERPALADTLGVHTDMTDMTDMDMHGLLVHAARPYFPLMHVCWTCKAFSHARCPPRLPCLLCCAGAKILLGALRVLIGGSLAMGITYGLGAAFGTQGI